MEPVSAARMRQSNALRRNGGLGGRIRRPARRNPGAERAAIFRHATTFPKPMTARPQRIMVDHAAPRRERPFVFTNLKTRQDMDTIVRFIQLHRLIQ